jgi:uncharacterized protein with ACT and thioredoxin-like domain
MVFSGNLEEEEEEVQLYGRRVLIVGGARLVPRGASDDGSRSERSALRDSM